MYQLLYLKVKLKMNYKVMIKYIKKIVAVVLILVIGIVPSFLIIYEEGFVYYLFTIILAISLCGLLFVSIKLLQND